MIIDIKGLNDRKGMESHVTDKRGSRKLVGMNERLQI